MPKTIMAPAPALQRSGVQAPTLHHAGHTDTCGTFYPEDDSPPVVSIGSRAAEERIERLAARHGLDARALNLWARRGL
jgi:hypothetical protein